MGLHVYIPSWHRNRSRRSTSSLVTWNQQTTPMQSRRSPAFSKYKLCASNTSCHGSRRCPPTSTARATISRHRGRMYFRRSSVDMTRRAAMVLGTVTNWGSGSPRREFLHVDDMAAACVHLLEHYDGPDQVNVGTGGGLDDQRDCRDCRRRGRIHRSDRMGYHQTGWNPTEVVGCQQTSRFRLGGEDRIAGRHRIYRRVVPSQRGSLADIGDTSVVIRM